MSGHAKMNGGVDQAKTMSLTVGDIVKKQPLYVNYGRVFLDLVMVVLLISTVATGFKHKSGTAKKSLNVDAMPIYIKTDIKVGDMWNEAFKDKKESYEVKVEKFKVAVALKCTKIQTHPLCMCVAASGTSEITAKNCLLKFPQPSVVTNWNIGTMSAALILWFLASLATSVGTLPYIETYITRVNDDNAPILTWNLYVVITYCFITLCAVVVPFIFTEIEFPGEQKHQQSLVNMLSWSLFALAFLGIYNWETVTCFIRYSAGDKNDPNHSLLKWQHASVNNFILYVHLLVSAPAIAMVLHMTQQWTEFSTIINTTLVLSTIFAVDAFSAEMGNYWSTEVDQHNHATHSHKHGMHDHVSTDAASKKHVSDMHMRLGLIRMFAWVINLVMLVLLFTLAYPIEVENQKINSAIFVVIVVAYAAVFLAPDLVREFTNRVSFNSIQFRLYGDFVVRAMTLFFVWRASITEIS